eukprot:gene9188-11262_t
MAIGWMKIVTNLDEEKNRIAYSFVDGICVFFCALCYLIHIAIYKFKKIYVYQDETILDQHGKRRRKRRSKPWAKIISKILCYYRRIDMDEEDHRKQLQKEEINRNNKNIKNIEFQDESFANDPNNKSIPSSLNSSNSSNPNSISNSTDPSQGGAHVIYIEGNGGDRDSSHIEKMEAGGYGMEMTTFSNNSTTLTGSGAHNTPEFLNPHEFKNSLKDNKNGIGQSDKSFNTKTKEITREEAVVTELMPKYEISYRNYLWVVLYQLFVIGTWFWLHNFSIMIREREYFSTPFLAFVSMLSVEYYYEKMAEYVSQITMILFLTIIRNLDYKKEYYPSFTALSESNYHQLLWRYFYLICFEISYDLMLRFIGRKVMNIDISNRGRNQTISNYCTRFIFTLFLLYDLMDVYNIQMKFQGDE